MTRRTAIFFLVTIVGICSCLSPRTDTDSELLSVSDAVKATPRYRQAQRFDAFLRNALTPGERAEYFAECRKPNPEDVFCFGVLREKKLRRFLDRAEKLSETHLRQKPEPITPVVKNGKVLNWSKMQKANLKSLLAGMREFTLEDLKTAGKFALKRKECPNAVGVSAAALLEMHLPIENVSALVAQLYEKGARCTRRRTPNHEHYLTRAGLFWFLEKKYDRAEKTFMKVDPVDAFSGRSLYWLYRTRLAMGKKDLARRTLTRLKTQLPLSFHALMVQVEDKTDPLPPPDATTIPTRSTLSPAANGPIELAETLHEMAFTESATKVVSWALTDYTPREPQVRAYLSTLGDTPTQIRTLQSLLVTKPSMRNQTYLQLAYPKAYFELFSEFRSKVDPFLLLAVARKESTMDPRAVSPANAQGLLQLNPDTAKRMSGETEPNLFDPRTNAEIASRYLAELRDTMKGQLPLMIASYNAGEQTVANWTQRYPTNDLLLFVDLMPYRETRDYVGFVLANYFWYRRLYGQDAQTHLASLSSTQMAKVQEPVGLRAIKSVIDDTLKTSDWTDQKAEGPFIEKWKGIDTPPALPEAETPQTPETESMESESP